MKNNFLILESLKLIWLHNENSKRMKNISNIIIIMYTLLITGFLFLNIKNAYLIFLTNPLCYKVVSIYIKKGILHNEFKKQFKIFLNELNLSSKKDFILYKKLEFDKYVKLSPTFSSRILKKYHKTFPMFPLVSNITKIPKKYNLYQKILLIRCFNIWRTTIIKHEIFFSNLGPFFTHKKNFFKFHNVKIKNNNLEIKVEP